jgi:hypothetical protein
VSYNMLYKQVPNKGELGEGSPLDNL